MFGKDRRELGWIAVAAGTAAVAGAVVNRTLEHGWRAVTDEDPPTAARRRGSWRRVLAWTAVTALAASLGQLLAEESAAAGWKKATGRKPPRV
jgi:hypothetical protein